MWLCVEEHIFEDYMPYKYHGHYHTNKKKPKDMLCKHSVHYNYFLKNIKEVFELSDYHLKLTKNSVEIDKQFSSKKLCY